MYLKNYHIKLESLSSLSVYVTFLFQCFNLFSNMITSFLQQMMKSTGKNRSDLQYWHEKG